MFGLFLHRLRPEAELVTDAGRAPPGHPRQRSATGAGTSRPTWSPPVFVDRALGQARAGARYVRELLPAEVRDPGLRPALAEAGAVAGAALDAFAEFLGDLRSRATGGFAIGEARYSRLLREKELLPSTPRRLRERGRAEYERLSEELGGAGATGRGRPTTGRPSSGS